ncbi:MAG: hypothetical protein JXR37_35455 [Kiritimatiellae bacterium]|nr:hypothetical protein [Kiritimatiellia bacterium]
MREDHKATCAALAAIAMLALCGCTMVRRGPSVMVDALLKQSDPALVQAGTPAYLLLLDALVESKPDKPDYLLAASDANTAYAAAFLSQVELERARIMYAKARDYGLKVLCRNRQFQQVADRPFAEFETAVPSFGKRDVPALYSTATAWLGWIINSPNSMEATSQLSKALALMGRVLELNPGYQHGGAEMFFGIYYAVQPRGAGQDLEKSRQHFLRAIEFGGPDYLLCRVAYAEFYARYAFDAELFEEVLRDVLAHEGGSPGVRLMNAVAKQRANALLDDMEDLF